MFDLGKFCPEHLLWVCQTTRVDCCVLGYGEYISAVYLIYLLISLADHAHRYWLCCCVHSTQLQDSQMAAFSGSYVRFYGPQCCLSCIARYLAVWYCTVGETDWFVLACSARSFVCYRCWPVCCKFETVSSCEAIRLMVHSIGSRTRATEAWFLRYLGELTSDFSCLGPSCGCLPFRWSGKGI